MKPLNTFKKLALVSLLCASGAASAQIVQPLKYGFVGANTVANYYADYVGLRVEVDAPAVIAGDKNYTYAYPTFGGAVTTPITSQIYMDTLDADSFGCSTFTGIDTVGMRGKIVVLWRGPISAGCEFVCKSYYAGLAGAAALVLINEYPEGPVGMGTGTTCTANTTLPVFMIGNTDGIALSAQYHLTHGNVTMTISPWGQNFTNDLGFVPSGVAGWHDYAIPQSQLVGNGSRAAYMALDGAFIANYGSHNATNVSLIDSLTFTPTGGSATQIHLGQTGVLSLFTPADSIFTFYNSKYALPVQSTTGEYTITYRIKQDSINQFTPDNTKTANFYSTDSVFSKGTYNFSGTPQPVRNAYEGFNAGNEYLWGPMYYVANEGYSLSTVQYSIQTAFNATTMLPNALYPGSNNVYLYKWVDANHDGLVQPGELNLVSLGVKTYAATDTSTTLITLSTMGDSSGNAPYLPALDSNSWYYIAVDVPSTTSAQLFLGSDGVLSPYPRIYGFYNNDSAIEYSSLTVGGGESAIWTGSGAFPPCPNTYASNANTVDSFIYNQMIGLIPAVAMITKPNHVGINTIVSNPFANVSIYPNPARDYLNVSISLQQSAKTVSYEIIDDMARFVSKETHNNVQNEVTTLSTTKLAPGNYYLIITADDRAMAKKFTVLK